MEWVDGKLLRQLLQQEKRLPWELRALEREPKNRYASVRELAWDLKHPETVGVADRRELRD
jgi:hypothetical protein